MVCNINSIKTGQGPLSNYVDRIRAEGVKKCLFQSTLRVQKLSTQGGGSNNGKIPSPQVGINEGVSARKPRGFSQETMWLLKQSYIFTRAELLFTLCHEILWSRALEHLENVKLKMQCINCKNKHLICLTYFTVNSVIQDLIQSPGNCKLKLL